MNESTASVVRWREVLALFERVLDCRDEDRAALMRSIAAEQPALYPQLLTLLAADQSAESARFIAMAPPIESADAPYDESLAGQMIGPYRVVRHIGSGGMGQVWLAERADGRFEGVVAIKLLRAFGDPLIAKRFEREGQLLARLQHPNIARLLDAGALANGQLYLVLEYVDGERIDHYFDAKRLTVPERIRAFLPVCEAVAHAHTQLVVHRDLKPSNILVTRDGQVKLLDFGIAKLLAERDDESATELTQMVGSAFTPEFAAPEQIRGDSVSTQTDLYALGAILFRLLAGVAPHDTSPRETARAREERVFSREAPLMSSALAMKTKSNASELLSDIAHRRSGSIERLQFTLKGDLDRVIGKALRLDALERYRSVNELRDDFERYLRDEPVSVGVDSLAYRARKFVLRHKVGVAASAAIAAAIVTGVIGTLWQANIAKERSIIAEQNAERALQFERAARSETERAVRGETSAKEQAARAESAQIEAQQAANIAQLNEERAREQRARADTFRKRAETEAVNARNQAAIAQRESGKALSVKDFLVELFNTGDINIADAEARELKSATTRLLNRGTERLKTQLIDQPEVRSELIDTVASLHLSIESPDQAEVLYREQLAMLERGGERDSSAIAETWMKIGRALRNQRKYKEAEDAQVKALAIMDRKGDTLSEARGRALLELVQMSFWTNTAVSHRDTNFRRAKESIAILQRQSQPSSLGEAWYGLGRLHEAAGENREAAIAYEQGIAATIGSVGGDRHAAVAGGRQMRARVLGFAGQFDEAKRELMAAQRVFEDTVGVEHRFSVDVRAELAEVAHQTGESERALSLFRQTLAEQAKLRGESHSSTNRTHRLLAEALYDLDRVDETIAMANDALARTRKNPTSSKIFQARLMSLLGRAYVRTGQLALARESLSQAEIVWQESKENFGSGVNALDFASLHIAEGQTERAAKEVARALPLLSSLRGKTRNEYWRARVMDAELQPVDRRVSLLVAALSDFTREPEHRFFPRAHAQILESLGSARLSRGQRADACSSLSSALTLRNSMDGALAVGTRRLSNQYAASCAEFASK
jgi:serine/threonine protein kinase